MSEKVTHLPALLQAIAGVSRSRARQAIAQGQVVINGKPWTDLDVPHSVLLPDGPGDARTWDPMPVIEHPFGGEVIERQRRGII